MNSRSKPGLAGLTLFLIFAGLASQASADIVLSTDFTGRTVSGLTASNFTWFQNGLSAATTLTAVHEVANSSGNLFDTGAAQGHFAVDNNIGNGGVWSTTTTLNVTGVDFELDDIVIDWRHFNNAGAAQGAGSPRQGRWTVDVIGSVSGLLGSVTVDGANAISGSDTLAFSSPLMLTGSQTYDVKFTVDKVPGSTSGNNTGFDALTFNGTFATVPEPSSLALIGMIGLGAICRRRRS